jgi:predicted permease
MMDNLARDVRFALRLIAKTPILSLATIVTLALGVGLNAGVFTVVSGLMLRPRVTADRDSFIHLQPSYSGTRVPRHESPALSTRDYHALRDRTATVRSLAAWIPVRGRIGDTGPADQLTLLVSCNFFDVYGLDHLERGRLFRPEECERPGVPVAIISDELWRNRFNADEEILRKPLEINGEPFTVVGVTPARFPGRLRGGGVWLPYSMDSRFYRSPVFDDPATAWLWVDGRLRPGVSRAAAASELNVLLRQQDRLAPGRVSAVAITDGALIHEPAVRPVAMFLLPLVLGAVGLVLLIACGNVTLLLLSRAVARQREIAIRLAIGCSRARLVAMLLTESVLLAALGMPLSVWLAWQAPAVMRRMAPEMPYYPLDPDFQVFSYLAAASIAAGVAAGLAPALESLRQRLTAMLGGQDPLAQSGGRSRLRDTLIAAQLGMSLVLLAGTAVFLRAERAIAVRDPAVDAAHVMVAPYEPPRGASAGFMTAIATRVRALPGVRNVAYAAYASGEGDVPFLVVSGRAAETRRPVPISVVSREYFETMKRPMLQGDAFGAAAAAVAVRPIVISDALARTWWPGGNAIGARLESSDGRRFDVTGVVHADVLFAAGTADTIQAFTLAPPQPSNGLLMIRFDGDAASVQSAVHGVIRDMSPEAAAVPLTLAAVDAASAAKVLPLVKMVGTLGLTAIALALVGVYGVVSFAVGRRTREIGVRIALGATPGGITVMVLRSGARPIAFGIVAGLVLVAPAAIALGRLFERTPVPLRVDDPLLYLFVAAGLAVVALVTMVVPARRASTVAPSRALRSE